MTRFARMISLPWATLALAMPVLSQDIVINEIHYHPLQPVSGPEPVQEEFIELLNCSTNPVNLAGWQLDRGVHFTFPNITVEPQGFLVVVADRTAFAGQHPTVTSVAGDWRGTLSNHGELIRLVDSAGDLIDSVRYANEGDWARRQHGPDDLGHRGWKWHTPADGFGFSLQLRNPALENDQGQNWAATNATPGMPNHVFSGNVEPWIAKVAHMPVIPRSQQAVVVTARVTDESPPVLSADLFYRVDALEPPSFVSCPMADDGQHGDGVAGDGIYGATIPGQGNHAVVEFYLEARDLTGLTRRWPALPLPAADGTNLPSRLPNALYQVDDSTYTGAQPLYKLIMIESERLELASLPCSLAQDSNAEMNGTFVSVDGTGTECRYLCGIRNRGHGTRCTAPPNYRVHFPTDTLWKSQRALNLNTVNSFIQVFGSVMARKAGLPGSDSRAVQVRVNNANLAIPAGGMYGSYAANEVYNNSWAQEHFPFDSGGNLYRADRDTGVSDFIWRGPDPRAYTNTYSKASNSGEDDWADLVQLHRIVGTNDLFSTETVRQVAQVEQWLLHLAVMALFGNYETGLNSGCNDDYYLYRGEVDARFLLIYHDLDSILGVGVGAFPTNDSIFHNTADNGAGAMLNRLVHWPDFEPIYYGTLQQLLETVFSPAEFDSLVDATFANYPQTQQLTAALGNLKNWMDGRRAYVQSVIASHVPPATSVPRATIAGEPRSPTPFTEATITVGGMEVTHYRFNLNNGPWSAERAVTMPVVLSDLPDQSTNTVYVVGRNDRGVYQDMAQATASRTWAVNLATPPVRLNEVLARNDSALNHYGTFPDGIEMFNEAPVSVDLSGLRLTDDPARPEKFTFPNGTILPAQACLVVYANNPDGTPGHHLGFGLNQEGDEVYLFDRITQGGALLDSVAFGGQLPDLSIGRIGSGGAWRLTHPTFGMTNRVHGLGSPANLKINEWLALGTSPFPEDFLELYNPDPQPVALGGLSLSDEPFGAPHLHRIADLSFVAGRGHSCFIADEETDAGANHLGFRLSAELGEISLKFADGATIDCVSYPPQRSGISQGRCPDGDVKITDLGVPTPGFPNDCPQPSPLVMVPFIPVTNLWRYDQLGADLGSAWKERDYDDSGWPAGGALLGQLRSNPYAFVPEEILTPLSVGTVVTYYFRTHFTMPDEAGVGSMQLSNVVDDGAVFYVNGTEVGRINMPAGPVGANTPASTSVTDATWQGPVAIPTNLVQVGDNVLAVEVHQISPASWDVMFGLRLDGVVLTSVPDEAGVVLNELLANNGSIVEADGSTPDWVEIFNPSTNTVDLADMSLSDSPSMPRQWVFPSPSILAGLGSLVVRSDGNAPASPTNTGFGLKRTGDSLYLFNKPARGGQMVDFVHFGLQIPDYSIGRIPSGGSDWRLTLPTGGRSNVAASVGFPFHVKVNEWMAAPSSGEDWFEVYNPEAQPVALGGLWLSDNLESAATRMRCRIPPLSFVGGATNAYQRFLAGPGAEGADRVDFKLNGTEGESLGISLPNGTLIHGVQFGPQQTGVSEGYLPDGQTNRVRFPGSSSPGEANYLVLTGIVINEVLANSDLPLEDAIEVHNLTADPIDIGGWYLSDAKNNLRKYLIPLGTILPAHGFRVFYEYQFNNPDFPTTAFALSSAHGDEVYLSQAGPGGQWTGYRAQAAFGPSEPGVSFGRYGTSLGADFVAMSRLSFGTAVTPQSPTNDLALFRTGLGATNPYPQVGPVVIGEIMYHPPDRVSGGVTNDNVVEEFIELRNISGAIVPLYNPASPAQGWQLRQAVEFEFNASHAILPHGHLLVVSFDPDRDASALASFRARYGSDFALAGPYRGRLSNSGETVELLKPGPPQTDSTFPYMLAEKVVYQDGPPWPSDADGLGASLQRVSLTGYANDPTNWISALPSPGPSGVIDSDGDGLPDTWEDQYGFEIDNPADALEDADGDGLTNGQEYLSGTDPRDILSYLRVLSFGVADGLTVIEFLGVAERTYTIQYRDDFEEDYWRKLTDVGARPVTETVTIIDAPNGDMPQRFYRLVTPALPD